MRQALTQAIPLQIPRGASTLSPGQKHWPCLVQEECDNVPFWDAEKNQRADRPPLALAVLNDFAGAFLLTPTQWLRPERWGQ